MARTPRPESRPVSPIRPAARLSTAELEEALQVTLRSGARAGQLLTVDGVLPLVDLLAPPADDDTVRGGMRAIAAEEIIRAAIAAVGGTYATVLEILLQIAPAGNGKPLSERREQCAQLLNVSADTFAKTDAYEKTIMRVLLMEIYRILAQRGTAA